MKRLWIAIVIMALVFCATLYNAHYLSVFTHQLTDLLADAEALAEAGDWDRAEDLTGEAYQLWEDHSGYLHILLRHQDTDQVHIGFREVWEFLNRQEDGEYSAANARLMTQIELLYEAEQLTLKNVL